MTLEAYWQATRAIREQHASPYERAVHAGEAADRLAFAFASGYQAALSVLFPGVGLHEVCALSATEAGGAHPREIRTRLDGNAVTGTKLWTTGAPFAGTLFVVASVGERDGQNQLKVARVAATAPGVKLTPLEDMPFVPELPHAQVDFRAAPASEVLEGDGYTRYLKPFRTVEDVFVLGAVLGYVRGVARRCGFADPTAGLLVEGRRLSAGPFSSPELHVALAAHLNAVRAAVDALDWSKASAEERERWERDRPLLDVANKARQKRLERARAQVGH